VPVLAKISLRIVYEVTVPPTAHPFIKTAEASEDI
jgi:hypothetical protein